MKIFFINLCLRCWTCPIIWFLKRKRSLRIVQLLRKVVRMRNFASVTFPRRVHSKVSEVIRCSSFGLLYSEAMRRISYFRNSLNLQEIWWKKWFCDNRSQYQNAIRGVDKYDLHNALFVRVIGKNTEQIFCEWIFKNPTNLTIRIQEYVLKLLLQKIF